jgi:signal transduction histidine kinase
LIALAAALLLFARSVLQRAFLRPLSELLSAMRRFGKGDLDHRVSEHGAAEMVDLQRTVNRMADEVAQSRAQLVRTEKQAALGALVPVIAHNIRNPLASIRATAQLMQAPDRDPDTADGLRGILGAVDRLSSWLTALLSYLHPQKAHRHQARLADCADQALTLLEPRLAEKSMMLDRRNWSEGESVALDTHLMEQAIYGLLANAVEASPKNATLTVSTGSDGARCWLSIEDGGPGLPFEPNPSGAFPGPSTKTYGSGLGIPFAYKICELHDGRLDFRAADPTGTTATISVPTTTTKRDAA